MFALKFLVTLAPGGYLKPCQTSMMELLYSSIVDTGYGSNNALGHFHEELWSNISDDRYWV